MSEQKKRFKTIKVDEETYKKLKESGFGISKAVAVFVKAAEKTMQSKLEQIQGIGEQIMSHLAAQGFFNISFGGYGLEAVEEESDAVVFRGWVKLRIPNPELRAKLIEIAKQKQVKAVEQA
jgi:hypothetical protein